MKMNQKYKTDLLTTALGNFPLQQLKPSCETNHSNNGISNGKTNFKSKK